MSLGEHLDELRRRLMAAIFGLVPLFAVSMYFGQDILRFLIKPMREALKAGGLPAQMISTNMFENIFTYLKIAMVGALVVGFPWVLFQLWKFIGPGLYRHERRFVVYLFPFSALLSVTGVAFFYYVVLPVILAFSVHFATSIAPITANVLPERPAGIVMPTVPPLAGDPPDPKPGEMWVNTELQELRVCIRTPEKASPEILGMPLTKPSGVTQTPRMSEYMDQMLVLSLAFAGAFQMPVVVLLLGWIGILTPEFLRRNRKYAIFAIAVISAILTPPDPISIFLLGVPLYLLYELGVFLLKTFPRPSSLTGGREGNWEATE